MKKLLSIVLALALVFSMSVCFAEDAATDATEETKVEAIAEEAAAEEAATEETAEEETATEEEATEEEATEEEAATEETATEETAEDVVSVTIDGVAVVFPDQQPVIINDRTLVPLRAIFEAIGAVVTWDNDTNTAMAVKEDTYIFVQIDNNILIRNNDKIELDVPAMLINDRTMVPVRAIVEAFGEYTVDWVEGELKVVIETKVEEPVVEESTEETVEETTEEAETEETATEEATEEVAEEDAAEETTEETATEEDATTEEAAEEETVEEK